MSLFISPIKTLDIVASSGKIYGFFHIGFMNNWDVIFNILVDDLKNSGLLEATEKIFVGTAGIPPSNFILPEKFLWASSNLVLEDGENETIKLIYSSRMRLKGNKIWYIHTKGSANWHQPLEHMIKVTSWRNFMTYFIIKNWRNCLRALQSNDICGANWLYIHKNKSLIKNEEVRRRNLYDQVGGTFCGNFWWANGDYISKMETSPTFNPHAAQRCLAEFFLGRHNPIVFDFCDFYCLSKIKELNGNFYGKYIDPKWYERPYFIL
jgi:hypothetical protein